MCWLTLFKRKPDDDLSSRMPRLSIVYAVGLGLIAALVALVSVQPTTPAAAYQSLSLFRVVLETGQWPEADPFTYQPVEGRFHVNEWGAGATTYLFVVATDWGQAGWALLKLICFFAVAVGCYGYAVRRGVPFSIFAPLSCLALTLAFGFPIGEMGGGELISTVFLVWQLILLNSLSDARRWSITSRSFALFWLYVAWGNLHGWVLIGLAILFFNWMDAVCVRWQLQRSPSRSMISSMPSLLVLVVAMVGCLFNPLGIELFWAGPGWLANGTSHFFMIDPNWQSTPMLVQWAFIVSTLLAGYGVWKSPQWPVFESFVLALLILLTIRTTQVIGPYLVIWLCLVSRLVDHSSLGRLLNLEFQRREKWLLCSGLAAAILFMGVTIQSRLLSFPADGKLEVGSSRGERYPEQAVAFLRSEGFVGNLFAPIQLGSYLSWELHPVVRISGDSRGANYFSREVLAENTDFYRAAPSWRTVLNNPLHQAILVPTGEPIFAPLKLQVERDARAGWKQIYQDAYFAVFARNEAKVAEVPAEKR